MFVLFAKGLQVAKRHIEELKINGLCIMHIPPTLVARYVFSGLTRLTRSCPNYYDDHRRVSCFHFANVLSAAEILEYFFLDFGDSGNCQRDAKLYSMFHLFSGGSGTPIKFPKLKELHLCRLALSKRSLLPFLAVQLKLLKLFLSSGNLLGGPEIT